MVSILKIRSDKLSKRRLSNSSHKKLAIRPVIQSGILPVHSGSETTDLDRLSDQMPHLHGASGAARLSAQRVFLNPAGHRDDEKMGRCESIPVYCKAWLVLGDKHLKLSSRAFDIFFIVSVPPAATWTHRRPFLHSCHCGLQHRKVRIHPLATADYCNFSQTARILHTGPSPNDMIPFLASL